MRAVWAQKETTCSYDKCLEKDKVIHPGERRLDDQIRYKERVIRQRFHLKCFAKYVFQWFLDNPYEVRKGVGGRPTLQLSEKDRTTRRLTLGKINALKQYYLPRLPLMKDITAVEDKDLKRFQQFHKKMQENLKILEGVGGIPEAYQNIKAPTLGSISKPSGVEEESTVV